MLLRAGDYVMLRPAAFHRVFTLQPKVVAYANFLDMRAISMGLPSLMRHEDAAKPRTGRPVAEAPVRVLPLGNAPAGLQVRHQEPPPAERDL